MTDPVIIRGDCEDVLGTLEAGSVSLAYLDPPFMSGRDHVGYRPGTGAFRDKGWRREWPEVLPAQCPRAVASVLDFAWGIAGRETAGYLFYVGMRLVAVRRVLADRGSLWLHCDDSAVHWLRHLADAVMGRDRFRNHVVWERMQGSKPPGRRFPRCTDHLLYYAGEGATYRHQWKPVSEATLRAYRHTDPDGRRYLAMPTGAPGGHGAVYSLGMGERMPSGGYSISEATARRLLEEGRLIVRRDRVPTRKKYLDEVEGAGISDIWTDVKSARRPEHLGYPTQKPLALLSRIIEASSDPGDLVLDPFCGSGTTLVAARRLRRRAIGIDESEDAVRLAGERLSREGAVQEELGV